MLIEQVVCNALHLLTFTEMQQSAFTGQQVNRSPPRPRMPCRTTEDRLAAEMDSQHGHSMGNPNYLRMLIAEQRGVSRALASHRVTKQVLIATVSGEARCRSRMTAGVETVTRLPRTQRANSDQGCLSRLRVCASKSDWCRGGVVNYHGNVGKSGLLEHFCRRDTIQIQPARSERPPNIGDSARSTRSYRNRKRPHSQYGLTGRVACDQTGSRGLPAASACTHQTHRASNGCARPRHGCKIKLCWMPVCDSRSIILCAMAQ
jgi:hypothetical protein